MVFPVIFMLKEDTFSAYLVIYYYSITKHCYKKSCSVTECTCCSMLKCHPILIEVLIMICIHDLIFLLRNWSSGRYFANLR